MAGPYPEIAAALRKRLQKGDKGEVRGDILPLARSGDGSLGLAMPEMLRHAGIGLLDLMSASSTGEITPEAGEFMLNMTPAGGLTAAVRPSAVGSLGIFGGRVNDRQRLAAALAGNAGKAGVESGMKTVDLSSPGFRKTSVGDTEISYTVGNNGIVEINKIETPRDKRGGGSARAALEQFLSETDAAGVRVALSAEPMDKGVSKSGLERFYKGAGFVPNKGRNKDFETRAEFIRAAKQDRLR